MPRYWLLSGAVSACFGLWAAHAPAGVLAQPFTVTVQTGNPSSPNTYQTSFPFQNTARYTQANAPNPVIGPSATQGFVLGSADQQHPSPGGGAGFDVLDFNLMRVNRSNIPGFDPSHRVAVFQFNPLTFGPRTPGATIQVSGAGSPYARIDTFSGQQIVLEDPRPVGPGNQAIDTGSVKFTPAGIGTDAVGASYAITLPNSISSWNQVRTVDLAFAVGLRESLSERVSPEPATLLIWGGLIGVTGLTRRRRLRRGTDPRHGLSGSA